MNSICDLIKDDELYPELNEALPENRDRNGTCYHVITQAWAKETIFYADVAQYRHNLLCEMCADRRIVIVFSAANPNHTHDVFIVQDWKKLASVMRVLNTNVSKYIRRQYPNKVKNGKKLFKEDIAYIRVRDIVHLFYLGKYIHDNPLYLKAAGKPIPFSCFFMFENGYLKEPYREDVYKELFGLTFQEVYRIYSTKSKQEVLKYAQERFSGWTREMNERFFSKPRTVP